MTLTEQEIEVLRMVDCGEVTWQRRGRGRVVKVWASEDDWSPMTTAERVILNGLVSRGLATWVPGVGLYSRGPCEMTGDGRRALHQGNGEALSRHAPD